MPKDILMPALSPTMEEGKIAKWNKKEGDRISSGDIIAEIETDKAVMEYEAVDEGILGKILIKEGTESVKVNSVIGVLLEDGEDQSNIETYVKKTTENDIKEKNIDSVTSNELSKSEEYLNNNTSTSVNFVINNNKDKKVIFITPLAKNIAKQNNVDIKNIKGTGPNGRIIKEDIMNYIKCKSIIPIIPSELSVHKDATFSEVKNSSMRMTIAKRLLESKNTIPHYYLNIDCVVDSLLNARKDINNKGKDLYKISVNDFIIKAVGLAMKDVPEANSSWQGDKTRVFNRVDVSVAVAIPNGLITPIIKDVPNKGLIQISKEMKDLAYRAKEGKLKIEEYQGGGFSISNLGMFGIKSFSAIINPPQSGILAIGATEKRPIVISDNIVIANVLTITLSADHRVMDGAVGAKFLNYVKQYLENPVTMIL